MVIHNNLPLQVLWQQGISAEMLNGVFFGIARVLFLANVFQEFKVECLAQRRQPDWLIENTTPDLSINPYQPYQSLDWHLWTASVCDENVWHLNSGALLDSLQGDPTHKTNSRYEFVVINEPLFRDKDKDSKTILLGGGRFKQNAVITINHYLNIFGSKLEETDDERKKRKHDFFLMTQMIAIHEFLHIFGLYSDDEAVKCYTNEGKWPHCPNECVMYHDANLELYTKIQNDPLCSECKEKLPRFFK